MFLWQILPYFYIRMVVTSRNSKPWRILWEIYLSYFFLIKIGIRHVEIASKYIKKYRKVSSSNSDLTPTFLIVFIPVSKQVPWEYIEVICTQILSIHITFTVRK